MTRVDKLRKSKEKSIFVYDKFVREHGRDHDGIFCFFEGKMDHTYYGPIIRVKASEKNISAELYPIDCGGKSNVIELRDKIKVVPRFRGCKKMFFIDRDFDEQANLDDVFETTCYAIENFYVSEKVLQRIMRGRFELEGDTPNYNKILELYGKLNKEFHEKIFEFNAWLFFQRKQAREIKDEDKKVCLEQFDEKMKDNIKVSLDGITVRGISLEELKESFTSQYDMSEEVFELLKGDFRYKEPRKWYRGKQEFYFMCIFLQKVIEQLGKARKGESDIFEKDSNMKKIELNIETKGKIEQNIQVLSSYADIPEELYAYVEKMCKQFQEVV